MANETEQAGSLKLGYTILCDDVRLEVGNKLSLMGVFQNIAVEQLPVTLIKFAVVNHWQGEGAYLSEVRVLTPDRQQFVVASQPTSFEIEQGGFADNISFFVNVSFHAPGRYWVQTLVNSTLFQEHPLVVLDARTARDTDDEATEAIN
jgi:ribosomal protein S16